MTNLKKYGQLSIANLKNFYTTPYNPIGSIDYFFDLKNNISDENTYRARKPEGLVYKTSPILLFGCSFAYGHALSFNQTFSYKLANIIQRPIYNRAIAAGGFQHMYYQTTTEEFYKSIPPCEIVIYVFIVDHYRRMLGNPFFIHSNELYLHYKYKKGTFKLDDFNNPFTIFYKYNYTLRAIRKLYNSFYLNNNKNADKITDEAIAYFIKTRKNLQNHWHNKIKFVVFFYQPYYMNYVPTYKFIYKLRQNGFYTITADNLTKEDLNNAKYKIQNDWHPNEAAWDLLTPLFIEKMKQEKIF
ncbi:hypothetical protein IJG14_05650 [bacterium]|nr:hypothetical protein [bacterium]